MGGKSQLTYQFGSGQIGRLFKRISRLAHLEPSNIYSTNGPFLAGSALGLIMNGADSWLNGYGRG
jgi:hypothetical protein